MTLMDWTDRRGAANAQVFIDCKIDVPDSGYDRLASPVSALALITTIDRKGRINAAPVATCLRNNHHPTCFEFTMDTRKHTVRNIQDTREFVVNIVPFERTTLEKVQVTALPFPLGVNELQAAELTAIPSRVVQPPRVGECRSHFECVVEWTKEWFETRITIVGRVVAASVNRDCLDQRGFVIHERLMPAQYAGLAYDGRYLANDLALVVG
jgi:flavin reductase (DIM6/NTAB) family NADH-FMN oxidoreductase RutF